MASLFRAVVLLSFACALALGSRGRRDRCLAVAPWCANMTQGYLQMLLPNKFGHDKLEDVSEGLRTWTPLVGASVGKFHCPASLIKMFLCSIYAPVCVPEMKMKIEPCRSLCVKARDTCDPVMRQHSRGNITWPNHHAFNCSNYVDSQMCINDTTSGGPSVRCDDSTDVADVLKEACASDFVMKAEVTKFRRDQSGDVLRVARVRAFQPNNKWKAKKFKRLFFPPGTGQECGIRTKTPYFIAGNFEDGKGKKKAIVTTVLRWSRAHKRLIRKNSCSQV